MNNKPLKKFLSSKTIKEKKLKLILQKNLNKNLTKKEFVNKLISKLIFLNQSNQNFNKLIKNKLQINKQKKIIHFLNDLNKNLLKKATQTSILSQKIFYDYSIKNRLEKPVRVELKNAKSILLLLFVKKICFLFFYFSNCMRRM